MKIKNPYFSVELSESQIANIRDEIKDILLKDLNLEIYNLDTPHISISYVLGNIEDSLVEQVSNEIVESPFKVKVVGIKLVDSPYYGGDIVSLAVTHSDEFLYCQEFLKENFQDSEEVTFKEFHDGFHAHISLFVIKNLPLKDKDLLSRYIEISAQSLAGKNIFGEKLCIYDPDRVKILERSFKQS